MGRAIADVLAEQGASVAILDITAERAEEAADELTSTFGRAALFAHCDVSVEPESLPA